MFRALKIICKSNAALVISRNVTARDRHDRQQPFNLRVAWPSSTTQTVGTGGPIYSIAWLQILEADLRRGLTLGGATALPGRRVVATPLHTTLAQNIPALSGQPAGSFKLGDDGSFAAIIPARKALTWHLLNNDVGLTSQVKERFWVTFQPGEVRTCANCHGINTADQAGNAKPTNEPKALRDLLRYWSKGGPAFSSTNSSAVKTDASVSIPVSRLGGSTGAIAVSYATQDGSAFGGSDYFSSNGTLNWADTDSTPKFITVSLKNNPTIAAPKTFTITLTGTNPAPVTPSVTTVAINQPPFETWVLAKFAANANDPTIASANVDYNGDGFTNLAKYAFNRTPTGAPDAGRPFSLTSAVDPSDGKTYLTLQFTRRILHNDISYHVETCAGVSGWAEDASVAHEISAAPDANAITETVMVRSVKSVDQIPSRRLFIRIEVTRP